MKSANFADRVFVPGEQDGFRFFLWGNDAIADISQPEVMAFSSTYAEPSDGAFLCELETGWLFVTGVKDHHNFRHTFFDDSSEAAENAIEMQGLGIPVLTHTDASKRVNADGVRLYSITAEERRRAAACLD